MYTHDSSAAQKTMDDPIRQTHSHHANSSLAMEYQGIRAPSGPHHTTLALAKVSEESIPSPVGK